MDRNRHSEALTENVKFGLKIRKVFRRSRIATMNFESIESIFFLKLKSDCYCDSSFEYEILKFNYFYLFFF